LLNDYKIFGLVGGKGYYGITEMQMAVLRYLISFNTCGGLLHFQASAPKKAYSVTEYFNDLKEGIWSELKSNKPIDMYRRNLQRAYVSQLTVFLPKEDYGDEKDAYGGSMVSGYAVVEVYPIVKAQIRTLLQEVNKAIPNCRDKVTKNHLEDIKQRLMKAINPAKNYSTTSENTPVKNKAVSTDLFEVNISPKLMPKNVFDEYDRKICY